MSRLAKIIIACGAVTIALLASYMDEDPVPRIAPQPKQINNSSVENTIDQAHSSRRVSHSSKVTELLPKLDDVRNEAADDPHSTPASLIAFAAELGERLTEALVSESSASTYLRELSECAAATDQDTLPSAQALCLMHAKLVVRKFPALSETLVLIEKHSNPEALRRARLVGKR